jgi:predicted RNA methylase
MKKPKNNCRVFTPPEIVVKMLDILGYRKNLYGKKILENSCGNGSFMVEIVARYIKDCRREGYPNHKICAGLAQDICGFEIDENAFKDCLRNLNDLLAKHSLNAVDWNIRRADVLRTKPDANFAYIVGNPPYITYEALPIEDREYIKDVFSVCKHGKPDYYYAFIESAIKHMRNDGRLVYLVPSNFFKTRFSYELRTYMLPLLSAVYDYKDQKIFASALTASAIVVCDKSSATTEIQYHDVVNNKTFQICKSTLNERWIFHSATPAVEDDSAKKTRFGDVFPASSSVATLYNNAFVIKSDSDAHKTLEAEVLRRTVSPKSLANNKSEHIIFPYYYDDAGQLQRYSEEAFRGRFPGAAKHLEAYRKQLEERDSDKIAKWFEYGRSQALARLNRKKLLLSTLVTNRVNVYKLDEKTIPYSGIYITAIPGFELADAKRILESDAFFEYVRAVGIHANGTSIRISIRDINDFRFRA